jgi:hypothetical protein
MIEATALKIMTSRPPSMVFTSLLNLMKIYQLVQKFIMGDTQTDRQHDIISLIFAYKKSRQKCGSLTFGV